MSKRDKLNPEVHAALIQAAATLTGAYYAGQRPYGSGAGPIGSAIFGGTDEDGVVATFGRMLHKAEAKYFEHLETDHKE
ncbi:hypothetical protein [Komagataeibacter medellinensis]|uniref:Uncharacterized protein n=1 Tax=Komagataeibacter medellinensis (strain NBRC 3288 / BCRC 11682 / LMG 1693 / Kondo 51) TaxID=634177 RepID=G2I0W0_KOMMN|nr:hypothetical protein [Komagataeibacter medellinensis]BAK84568.1 hypothetical protein GLX_21560 [Komagataeibacter medellinensis NBRC 3288]